MAIHFPPRRNRIRTTRTDSPVCPDAPHGQARRRLKWLALILLLLSCKMLSPEAEPGAVTTPEPTYLHAATRPAGPTHTPSPPPAVLATAIPSDTPYCTSTAVCTDTPAPSATPTSTAIPTDTTTPTPSGTPSLTPAPPQMLIVPYQGIGDAVFYLDTNLVGGRGVLQIMGNLSGEYFSVTSFNANGNIIDLLVNTTAPYTGYRPVNLTPGENVTWLQIKSEGYWSVWLLPISTSIVKTIQVPGVIDGQGDDVLMLAGQIPELARIQGNAEATHFAVFAHTRNTREMLINTTNPYSGIVLIPSDTSVLEILSSGDWTIQVEARD